MTNFPMVTVINNPKIDARGYYGIAKQPITVRWLFNVYRESDSELKLTVIIKEVEGVYSLKEDDMKMHEYDVSQYDVDDSNFFVEDGIISLDDITIDHGREVVIINER